MTSRLAAVLGDMDGTLIDSEPIWIAQQLVLAEKHGATWSQEQGLALVGADMHDTAGVRASDCVAIEDSSNGSVGDRIGCDQHRGAERAVLPERADFVVWPTLEATSAAHVREVVPGSG